MRPMILIVTLLVCFIIILSTPSLTRRLLCLDPPQRHTITRPRDESPESKKARKASVKAERATRRADKKATKEVFGSEIKVQQKTRMGKNAERGMRKL